MLNHPTLKEVLLSQDMGEKNADRICDEVLNDTFDAAKDPISTIIVNTFTNNDYLDYDQMITDINYAIDQLTRAERVLLNHWKRQ